MNLGKIYATACGGVKPPALRRGGVALASASGEYDHLSFVNACCCARPGVAAPERSSLSTLARQPHSLRRVRLPDYLDFRDQGRAFAGLAAIQGTVASLGARAEACARARFTSRHYFGVSAARGPREFLTPPTTRNGRSPRRPWPRRWRVRFGGTKSFRLTSLLDGRATRSGFGGRELQRWGWATRPDFGCRCRLCRTWKLGARPPRY